MGFASTQCMHCTIVCTDRRSPLSACRGAGGQQSGVVRSTSPWIRFALRELDCAFSHTLLCLALRNCRALQVLVRDWLGEGADDNELPRVQRLLEATRMHASPHVATRRHKFPRVSVWRPHLAGPGFLERSKIRGPGFPPLEALSRLVVLFWVSG